MYISSSFFPSRPPPKKKSKNHTCLVQCEIFYKKLKKKCQMSPGHIRTTHFLPFSFFSPPLPLQYGYTRKALIQTQVFKKCVKGREKGRKGDDGRLYGTTCFIHTSQHLGLLFILTFSPPHQIPTHQTRYYIFAASPLFIKTRWKGRQRPRCRS